MADMEKKQISMNVFKGVMGDHVLMVVGWFPVV
jgi:hypothetical protein